MASRIIEHTSPHMEFIRNAGRIDTFNLLRQYLSKLFKCKMDDVRVMDLAFAAFPMHESPLVPMFRRSLEADGEEVVDVEGMLDGVADGSRAEQIDWIHRHIDVDEVGGLDLGKCPGLKAFKTWKMLRGNYAGKMDWLKEIHKQGVKEGGRDEAKAGGSELKDMDYLLDRVDGLMAKGKLEGLVS